MSKAILIIDEMPNSCDDCPCAFYTEGAYCDYCKAVEGIKEIEYLGKNRPSWCPLRIIPWKLDDLGLEVWNNRKGNMLAPKGLFDEIFESEEE